MLGFRRLRLVDILLSSLAWMSLTGAYAAEAPNSGLLLETTRPTPDRTPPRSSPLPAIPGEQKATPTGQSTRIGVRDFRFSGNTVIGSDTLLNLIRDSRDQSLTLDQLRALAARITEHYQAAGYFLARAYLPPQDIRDGIVHIAILEGRLGRWQTTNRSHLSDATLNRSLEGLKAGEVVAGPALERRVLLLSDLPGIQASSSLKPGASIGTTDLDVNVASDRRYTADLGLDNHGSRYSGAWRLGGGINLQSPLGQGESFSLRGNTSGNDFNYARLAAQAPLGGDGFKLGVAYSNMRYELGKDFASLQARGTADITSLYGLYPLIRSTTLNLNTQLLYDHKSLDDRVDSTSTVTQKQLDVFTLGLSGDRSPTQDGPLLRWNLAWTAGRLGMDEANRTLDQAGHRTAGHYQKLQGQFSALHSLGNSGLQLFAQAQFQQAAKNLDSSEKLSLGGASGVRAYPQGEAPSDNAWILNLELRKTIAPQTQAVLFADGAQGKLNHSPIPADSRNQRNLSGAGVGVLWSGQKGLFVQGSLAWRTDNAPTADQDKHPRFWLQLIQYF